MTASSEERLLQRLRTTRMLAQIGAALWFSLDQPITVSALAWVRPLLGADGDRLLWDVLRERGVLSGDGAVDGVGLAVCLADWSMRMTGTGDLVTPQLVWTKPDCRHDTATESLYLEAVRCIIDRASKHVWLVAPFIDLPGIGLLEEALLRALLRGVTVRVLAHDVRALASVQSDALERIRSRASIADRPFELYEVVGPYRIHAKLVVADQRFMVIGSANWTRGGLADNLELGVTLGPAQSRRAHRLLESLVTDGIIELFMSTEPH